MIVVIDNFDSFTYNLVDILQRYTAVKVIRNDEKTWDTLINYKCIKGVLISPGPGGPQDSGISYLFAKKYFGKIPILGVCLGHQILAEIAGGKVVEAEIPMHGKTSHIIHNEKGIFFGIKNPVKVMRYHSLLVESVSLPLEWEITAQTTQGEIMALRHTHYNIISVQFHPESILTEEGDKMIKNWLDSLS